MSTNPTDHGMDEALDRAMAEANKTFSALGKAVEAAAREGNARVDVLKLAQTCGVEITAADLDELQVDHSVHVLTFVPWRLWFPWRPLWCWWWRRHYRYYWYRCCPYWWHRCGHCNCGC